MGVTAIIIFQEDNFSPTPKISSIIQYKTVRDGFYFGAFLITPYYLYEATQNFNAEKNDEQKTP